MSDPRPATTLRTLVVSGADEAYFPLLDELISSLLQWEPRPFAAIACLDVGLAPQSRIALERRVAHVVEPRPDLPIDAARCAEQPGLRARTAKPFLPRYFPGYDIYLWIDADAWVQKRFAIDWYIGAAAQGFLAAATHVHAAYLTDPGTVNWRKERMAGYFGQESVARIRWDMYLNSGVVALRADAPHWSVWAASFARGLEATGGKIITDQTALNQAVWMEGLPVCPLPAVCNWLTHLAFPAFHAVRGCFAEPVAPAHDIGILHLTNHAARTEQYELRDGSARRMSLRFPGPPRRGGGAAESVS